MAIPGDGTVVAFLYGPRNQWTLWLLGEIGGPVQLSPPPSKYEDPGYLPEGSGHPGLLLNDDGTHEDWRWRFNRNGCGIRPFGRTA